MNKKVRKQRVTTVRIWPTFSSMRQLAASGGIPMSILTAAKRKGCTFQTNTICDSAEFLKFYFAEMLDMPVEDVNWANESKKEEAITRKIKRQTLQRTLVERSAVEAFIAKITHEFFFNELNGLAQQLPGSLKGKTEVQIRDSVNAQIDLIKRKMVEVSAKWEKAMKVKTHEPDNDD